MLTDVKSLEAAEKLSTTLLDKFDEHMTSVNG
jgi:hypothetical protein